MIAGFVFHLQYRSVESPFRMQNRLSCRLSATLGTLLFALVTLSPSAFASQETSQEKQVFRFNVSPNGYPPYLIVHQNQPSGIMWDVVSVVARRLGYTVIAEQIPRKRVDQMLLEGYIDGTPRAREWADDPEQFLFTDPVVDIEEVFFVPAQSGFSYESPDDLVSKTIVTHLGYRYPLLEPYFEEGRIRRFDVSRDKDMFTFVLHGDRFDAAVADRLVGKWILRNEGLRQHFDITSESISNYGFRLMLRKDWHSFANRFNEELAKMKENGELDAILANYR
jgi:polar amino acid transport system substrate-binding protein